MLTQEKVKELFYYNHKTGILVRKVATNTNIIVGSVAGCLDRSTGYLCTGVNKKNYKNHRLIWLYIYGYFPESQIDHINRDRADNRLKNLREVSRSCNVRNSKQQRNNTSGVKGVRWSELEQNYRSYILVSGKRQYLGRFTDLTEAVAHRLAAEQCLNWSNCDSNSTAYQYMKEIFK